MSHLIIEFNFVVMWINIKSLDNFGVPSSSRLVNQIISHKNLENYCQIIILFFPPLKGWWVDISSMCLVGRENSLTGNYKQNIRLTERRKWGSFGSERLEELYGFLKNVKDSN